MAVYGTIKASGPGLGLAFSDCPTWSLTCSDIGPVLIGPLKPRSKAYLLQFEVLNTIRLTIACLLIDDAV